jgi:prefoldin alpha subunit
MEVDEEELSKRLLEIEYIRRELENYINALNALQMTQESLSRSLVGLSAIKNKSEILIPYSPDIFFSGILTDASSALVNIGSNIFKKLPFAGLKTRLENDSTEIGNNIAQIAQIIQKLQEEGSRLEHEANDLYSHYGTGVR